MRMYCEKYSATIPVATCIARQKRANRVGRGVHWGFRGAGRYDPGCRNCAQGLKVMAEYNRQKRPAHRTARAAA